MHYIHMVFAYFGPETVLPVTSILATVAAVVLMFGKSLFRLVAYWVRRATFRGRHGQAATGPHFGLGRRRRRNTSEAKAASRARQVNK
ncbi:MAG: hypothetical protein ABSE84_25770 [Isosphaeraceae bacterium]|jgi:hypothetical protein